MLTNDVIPHSSGSNQVCLRSFVDKSKFLFLTSGANPIKMLYFVYDNSIVITTKYAYWIDPFSLYVLFMFHLISYIVPFIPFLFTNLLSTLIIFACILLIQFKILKQTVIPASDAFPNLF